MQPEFQQSVANFIAQHHLETDVTHRMLDLISEAGELAKEILKSSDYGKTTFHPTEEWESELGDIFFSLICLANSTNTNLEDALENALQKYKNRLKITQDAGSGQ